MAENEGKIGGQRRLAAVLAVDVAGYSRLMGEDETGTARAVREHREAARPVVQGLGGRIVKTMGDGVLLEFPSVVAAVECAIAVQKLMVERNEAVPEGKRIVYRIGVHLGDVLIDGEDILGDGVNIAARLEGIAAPGGVCLSAIAYESVRGKVDADFTDLGERDLKNIARPVRVYAISPINTSPAPAKAGAHRADAPLSTTMDPHFRRGGGQKEKAETEKRDPPRLSIVVLPFANIGGDPEQEYFVDGVTESLTTDLSRISGSFVIARNTAFTYKGKAVDVKQIGRELNVRYVLEGSVQRGGNRLRVNVQLIEAETGAHLWAERFDKPIADLFDMQDEIVAHLANQLGSQLVALEARRAARGSNPDAMDSYFQGMAYINRGWIPENLKQARSLFERATTVDPDNVDARVGMAYADFVLGAALYGAERSRYLAEAEAVVTGALSVAPENALAHLVLGIVKAYTNRAPESIGDFERALALDRNLAFAHNGIGIAKAYAGRPLETEAHVKEALRLSPYDTVAYLWMTAIAVAKMILGKFDEAESWFTRSLERNRNYPPTHFVLAAALAQQGKRDAAERAVQEGLRLDPNFSIKLYRAGAPTDNRIYLAGREVICDGMRKAGVPEGELEKPAAPRLSIVVLPFANIGGDPEQEYFVDGVTESLTTDLSRISGAFVISRNTAFTYKGKPIDVKQIGRELNVRYVLEGSVQRSGNRLRVNVQLIEAETDKHLWAERFDKPIADLFDMQDEVVARLANQLDTELVYAEARRAERAPNPNSMDLYFQGMASIYSGSTKINLTAARDLFERALALDSHNVDALVGLAQAEGSMALVLADGNRTDYLAAAEAALSKALSVAPNHATAHYLLGVLYAFTNRPAQSVAELERALSLDRNQAAAHAWMGFAKLGVGRPAETEAYVREAFRLSPRNVRAYQWMTIAGEAKMFLDDYDAAVSWLRQAVEVNRNFNMTYFYFAAALILAGRHDEAKAAMQAGLALTPNFTIRDLRAGAQSDNPTYLALRERFYEGARLAGMPEG